MKVINKFDWFSKSILCGTELRLLVRLYILHRDSAETNLKLVKIEIVIPGAAQDTCVIRG